MQSFSQKKVIAICVVVLVLLGLSLWHSTPKPLEKAEISVENKYIPNKVVIVKKATIYVSGAVNKPGLYEVKPGIRGKEAIEIAGGMSFDADPNRVNLAKICKDGTHLNVPTLSKTKLKAKLESLNSRKAQFKENSPNLSNVNLASRSMTNNYNENSNNNYTSSYQSSLVNLNTASLSELETLPGVGPSTAQKIIDYRNKNRFNNIDDVLKVNGIGPAKFSKMKAQLGV